MLESLLTDQNRTERCKICGLLVWKNCLYNLYVLWMKAVRTHIQMSWQANYLYKYVPLCLTIVKVCFLCWCYDNTSVCSFHRDSLHKTHDSCLWNIYCNAINMSIFYAIHFKVKVEVTTNQLFVVLHLYIQLQWQYSRSRIVNSNRSVAMTTMFCFAKTMFITS